MKTVMETVAGRHHFKGLDLTDSLCLICNQVETHPVHSVVATVTITAADIERQRANTYEEKNKVYGDNFLKVGAVMEQFFPDGITLKGADAFNLWHLFELQIVKLTRFTNSNLTHLDSIHDEGVYGAMVEALLRQGKHL